MVSEISSFKVVVVGESRVGKSSIISSLSGYASSVIDESSATSSIEVQRTKTRLQIIDTMGKEAFQKFTPAYYEGSQGIMVVYDVTDGLSFKNVPKWLDTVKEHQLRDEESDVVTMLIGNKCDMEDKRVINKECGEQLANEQNLLFMEVSAVSNSNINEAFDLITEEMFDRQWRNQDDGEPAVRRNHCVVL